MPECIDLRVAATSQYNNKTRPLRYFVAGIGLVLGSVFGIGVALRGLTLFDVEIGFALLAYAAFAAWALTRMLVLGPVEIRLSPESIQLVYSDRRTRAVPINRRGTTIELSDLSSSRVLGRPAAGRGVPRLLRVDSGDTIALTEEALGALNGYLQVRGFRTVYEGAISGAPGSHLWRYAVR